MKLQSLNKDYKIFTNIVVFGAIAISLLVLYFSYHSLHDKSKANTIFAARKASTQLDESLSYIENLSNFIGQQIVKKKYLRAKDVASILSNTKLEINSETQNIFTWTLFDFIDDKNYVLASGSQGVLEQPVLIKEEQRFWIKQSRITPWTLISSKADKGLLSQKPIIPFGYGLTKKNGKFVGILSFGFHVDKLLDKLVSNSDIPYINFAFLDRDNNIVSTSKNFNKEKFYLIAQKVKDIKDKQGFITVEGEEFYYHTGHKSKLKVLTGVNKKQFLNQLKLDLMPRALNTLYLTIFFLILLYFFRARLLNPVLQLSHAADQISQGNLDVRVPKSEIDEVNSLSLAINKVKKFLIAEEAVKLNLQSSKDSAECANYNKTEFLASTAHELKNMLSGIIGLGELLKMNLTSPSDNGMKMKEKETENISWIVDIVKLGEESSTFVNDILDVNQAQTGDFKIERKDSVDLKNTTVRSIKLMKTRALKERKDIIYNFDKNETKLTAPHLDPRRVKQIIVNVISNAIKYSNENTTIKVDIYKLSDEESYAINEMVEKNIHNNHNFDDEKTEQLLSLLNEKKSKKEARIAIEIEDEGIGMNKEELKIATQKYGIVKNDLDKKIDSTGLGLPIVKYLIEAQGGVLEIKSRKGKGTKVRIIF